jgi:hypothetical protein
VDVVEEKALILGKDRLITYNGGLSKNRKDFVDSDNSSKAFPKMMGQG